MQSLELNRAYYHECVASILKARCPEIANRHAAALIGWGSEVLGNDDEHSKRYGWGPRVVLFLTPEDYHQWRDPLAACLQERVPPTFLGHPTRFTDPAREAPQPTEDSEGLLQIPITTCQRFIEIYLGIASRDLFATSLSPREWLMLTEASLLRFTAGEVYHDSIGDLTKLREYLRYFPDDVWRYRLAYQWTTLSWDIDLIGLCAHRGDTLSARIAAAESVRRIIGLVFLLNKVYKPGYLKWVHRQFYKLPALAADIGPVLDSILTMSDCACITELFYPVLDTLIEFQSQATGLPVPDYKHHAYLERGFFAYDLQPVIDGLRNSIPGELQDISFKIGGVDQWVCDQELLMGPKQLQTLDGVYDCADPMEALFVRDEKDRWL